jgi:hypothetical protein
MSHIARWLNDHVEASIPATLRRFFGFRLASVFVGILALWNILVAKLVSGRARMPAEFIANEYAARTLARSPLFLILVNCGISLGFVAVFLRRDRLEYFALRVVVYAILLGATVGELFVLLLPFHY